MDTSYSYQDSLNLLKNNEWSKLSLQNRGAVMQSIENEVARREGRPPCNVSLFSEPPKNGKIIAGQYANGKIELNTYHLNGASEDCLNTILHEGRHAYQEMAVKGEIYHHDKAQLKSWQDNMKPGNYIDPEKNRRAYYKQPIEADAREYASITSRQILAEQKIQYSSNKGINSYIAKTGSLESISETENKGIQSFKDRVNNGGGESTSASINTNISEGVGKSNGIAQGG
jgi:hypothetical protein